MATTKKKRPAPAALSVTAPSAEAGRGAQGGEPRADPKIPAAEQVDDSDVIVRKDGRRLRRRNIYFNAGTALRVQAYCAVRNIEMSDYVNGLAEKDLDDKGV